LLNKEKERGKRKNDGRKLNREAQAQIRRRSVQRVLDGESPEDVVNSIGYQRTMIYVWLAKYRYGGFDALKVHKSNGRPPKLSAKQIMMTKRCNATIYRADESA
jgi:transposase